MPFLRRASEISRTRAILIVHAAITHCLCSNSFSSLASSLAWVLSFRSLAFPCLLRVPYKTYSVGDFLYEEQYAVQILKNLVLGPLKINLKM